MTEKTTKLILVRHGMVEGVKSLLGHTDTPLSDEGRRGMEEAAARLEGVAMDAVYSSDLSRSMESASIIARGRGLAPKALPAFRELYMGLWDGLTVPEVLEMHPGKIREWWSDPSIYRTPEGESLADLEGRVLPALKGLIEAHRGGTVCLVAHGGVNRVILFAAMGLTLKRYYVINQDYSCINKIRYFDDGAIVIDLING